jgi:hypothetical protein
MCDKYISRANQYFLQVFNMQETWGIKHVHQRCLAKYPRGINLVYVTKEELGETYCPDFMVPPDRYFWNYKRLAAGLIYTVPPDRYFLNYERLAAGQIFTESADKPSEPLGDKVLKEIKDSIDSYDPQRSILWLFIAPNDQGGSHVEVVKADIPTRALS